MVKKVIAQTVPAKVMEETFSLCPVCLQRIPAKKVSYGSRTYLEKECKKHGHFKTLIWRGAPKFENWRQKEQNDKPRFFDTPSYLGCPYDCGICEQHKQEICCVLINLTERCNQHCGFCFASSDETPKNPDMSLETIEKIYDSLIAKNSENPYNIHLSGGEPTVRNDLPEIIAMGKTKGFKYIQLNTNGKRLGQDPEYAKKLSEAGLDCAYLQFDGTDDKINEEIRSEKLLKIKQQAIENCAAAGIGVVLVITVVPGVNDYNIGSVIDYGISMIPKVRGVSIQPVSYFGRFPKEPTDDMRVTIPQIIQYIEKQTDNRIKRESFLPLVSGDCFCSFHGNFVVMPDNEIVPITSTRNSCCCSNSNDAITNARNFIAKRFSASKEKVLSGSDFDSWDLFIKNLDSRGFTITCEAFQDVWNFDILRTQKCRLYVATPDIKLVPFCIYNMTDSKGHFLYGGIR